MARKTIAQLETRIAELEAQLAARPTQPTPIAPTSRAPLNPSELEARYPHVDHRGRRYRESGFNQRAYAP